jgi:PST family polysaccharide transporter
LKPFAADGSFQPGVELGETRQLAVRGAGFTLLSGGLGFGVQMVSTVVLARLLTPSDFGLVAMVTTFNLLLTNFGMNGFTEAIQQREQINRWLVSNLFWINLGIGAVLTVGFAASGSLMARFYGDAKVAQVAIAIAPTILLNSVAVEHLALLKRAMRFSTVSFNEVTGRTVAVLVAIGLGWAGFGYWALVASALAAPLRLRWERGSTAVGFPVCPAARPGRPR